MSLTIIHYLIVAMGILLVAGGVVTALKQKQKDIIKHIIFSTLLIA